MRRLILAAVLLWSGGSAGYAQAVRALASPLPAPSPARLMTPVAPPSSALAPLFAPTVPELVLEAGIPMAPPPAVEGGARTSPGPVGRMLGPGETLDPANRLFQDSSSAGTDEPPRLDDWFDGRGKRAPGSAPVPSDTDDLLELSQGWRTESQLKRLAKTPRSPAESFEFAVIGDAEPGRFWLSRVLFNRPGVFHRQLRRINDLPVDFVIQLGDMVSRGTPRNFHRFLKGLAALGLRAAYLTVIGNHDRRKPHGESDSKVYRAIFGPTDYHFDRGGLRFVVLDTSAGRLEPSQLDWLKGVLDTSLKTIVFTHMPPAILRAFSSYDPATLGRFKAGAEAFTRLVSEAGVERVYMGHIHAFGVTEHLGVRYVLTGGGGSPLFPSGVRERFHHFLRVRVGPEGVTETVYKDVDSLDKIDGSILTVEEASRPARSTRKASSRRRFFPGRGPRRTPRRNPG